MVEDDQRLLKYTHSDMGFTNIFGD